MDGVDLPPKPTGWIEDRMDMRDFRIRIIILTPTTYDLSIMYNCDVKLYLPQPLINFGLKHFSADLAYRLYKEAEKSVKDPVKSPYAIHMRNCLLYTRLIVPRMILYFNLKQWPLPRFPAFEIELSEEHNQLEAEAIQLWKDVSEGKINNFHHRKSQ